MFPIDYFNFGKNPEDMKFCKDKSEIERKKTVIDAST